MPRRDAGRPTDVAVRVALGAERARATREQDATTGVVPAKCVRKNVGTSRSRHCVRRREWRWSRWSFATAERARQTSWERAGRACCGTRRERGRGMARVRTSPEWAESSPARSGGGVEPGTGGGHPESAERGNACAAHITLNHHRGPSFRVTAGSNVTPVGASASSVSFRSAGCRARPDGAWAGFR